MSAGQACKTCSGKGYVDDGEIDHYSNGWPYENGPVKCVKDCPTCGGTKRAIDAQAIALEALELVAMLPATRGVYLLDQQDMDFVKRAIKALKEQA